MNNYYNYKVIALASLLVYSGLIYAGEKIDKTLKVDANGLLDISLVRTSVDIKTWDKSEVHVVGELDDAVKKFIFETSGSKTIIDVEVDDKSNGYSWSSGDDYDLTVYMPVKSSLIAGGVSSDVTLEGLRNNADISSVSGDVDISDVIAEQIEAETVSGDISISDSTGIMKINSVSGDIETTGNAPRFTVQTVSGDIEANTGETELIDFTSVSGDIEINFVLAPNGHIEADTVSGDINLNFGNEIVNARFDIDTGPGGDIDNNITRDKPESSFIGSEDIKFTSGNGKATVDLNTMSGHIQLDN